MKKLILSLIFTLLIIPSVNASFSDVTEDTKYQEAINFLQEQEIINGYSDGTFKPDNTLNRAELLKILIESTISEEEKILLNPPLQKEEENTPLSERGEGRDLDKQTKYQNCFSDVHDEWFAPYVCYAKEKGIINGYPDGTFRPAQNICNSFTHLGHCS